MDVDRQIQVIGEWVDGVDAATAQMRIDEATARFRSQDTRAPALAAAEPDAMRAALHESAHACVALLAGLRVTRATVHGGGGGCEYRGDDDSPFTVLTLAEVDLAGMAAEFHAGPVDAARQFHLAHSPDVLQASVRLAQLRALGPAWQLPTRTVVTLSACAVRSHWAAIRRLAACLGAVHELTGGEIRSLCGPRQ